MKITHAMLQDAANKYISSLKSFQQKYKIILPIPQNIDHVAIKAENTESFEIWLKEIELFATTLSYTDLNRRRIATAILKQPIIFEEFGQTNYLEIMEPRPEKVGKDITGLEHIEICSKNFSPLEKLLKKHGVPYQVQQSNKYHTTVVIKINETNQEIKFSNNALADILKLEEKDKNVTYIKRL